MKNLTIKINMVIVWKDQLPSNINKIIIIQEKKIILIITDKEMVIIQILITIILEDIQTPIEMSKLQHTEIKAMDILIDIIIIINLELWIKNNIRMNQDIIVNELNNYYI